MTGFLRRHPLLVPVLTTVVVVVFVMVHYQREGAFERFTRLRALPLLGIVGAILFRWTAPTLKFRLLTRSWERPLTTRECFRLQLAGACGSALTPAASGATPTYLWYLSRLGAKFSLAMAAMVYVTALDAILFSVTVPMLLPWYLGFVKAEPPMGIVYATLSLSAGALFTAFVLLWRPHWIVALVGWILRPFRRLRRRALRMLAEAVGAIREIRASSPLVHALCLLLTAAEWFGVYMVLPFAAMALGFEVNILQLIFIQHIMQVVAFVFPTPGGSGWFEAFLPIAAASAWPAEAAAPLILLWRFGAYWIYLLIAVFWGSSLVGHALERRLDQPSEEGPPDPLESGREGVPGEGEAGSPKENPQAVQRGS